MSEQERELADAFEELEAMEAELRRVSAASLSRMRQSSLRGFLLLLASPLQLLGHRRAPKEALGERKASARGAAARRELAHNVTVALLRENISALALCTYVREANGARANGVQRWRARTCSCGTWLASWTPAERSWL